MNFASRFKGGSNPHKSYRAGPCLVFFTRQAWLVSQGRAGGLHRTGLVGFTGQGWCLQELEAAVSCKYVAANAVNALQQVYQLLGNTSPTEKETMQQSWARILLKPELRRASEACQVLEQTALDKLQAGGTIQQARGVCLGVWTSPAVLASRRQ